MPLDPEIALLLERFAQADGRPVSQMTPAEARLTGRNLMALSCPAEEVGAMSARFIPGPTADLAAYVYWPHDVVTPSPAIVLFHGGGFVINTIQECDPWVRALVNRSGCVFITVNYQKAPEHPFPIPLEDCHAATQWVVDHADELGVDPARVGVAGDSSGGNLAAAVCLLAQQLGGPSIALQVLISPVLDYGWSRPSALEFGESYLLPRDAIEWIWSHYLPTPKDGENPLASPVRAPVLDGLPRTIMVTAEFDPLLDEDVEYAQRLRAAGVPVTRHHHEGMIHGFHLMGGVLNRTRGLYSTLGAEIRASLGDDPPVPRDVTHRPPAQSVGAHAPTHSAVR